MVPYHQGTCRRLWGRCGPLYGIQPSQWRRVHLLFYPQVDFRKKKLFDSEVDIKFENFFFSLGSSLTFVANNRRRDKQTYFMN